MKQQCHISFVYASWLILAGGFIFYVFRGEYLQACFWFFFIAVFLRLYVRYFPSLSRLMGYGSVEDQSAADVRPLNTKVFLYTGIGCPFCPLVKRRLIDLQLKMGFELKEIDVTFKPDVLIAKGIRALPVVEVGKAQWIGNATSEQLSSFIRSSAAQM
jgi:glutaredoxin